jgi:hypothetical protein
MDLNAAHAHLRLMLNGIDQELTTLLPATSLGHSYESAYRKLEQRLNIWQRNIALIQRDLSSAKHRTQHELSNVHELPRNERYRARQSAESRLADIVLAQQAAGAVLQRLFFLLGRLGSPTWPEIINSVSEVIDNAQTSIEEASAAKKQLQSMIAVAKTPGPQVLTASPASSQVDILLSLAVLGRILHMTALKIATKARTLSM